MSTNARTAPKVTGSIVGAGAYECAACGFNLTLEALEKLPECPACGAQRFFKASFFEHQSTTETALVPNRLPREWLDARRDEASSSSVNLAYRDAAGELRLHEVRAGWLRIGRSPMADIRLDDPSVSRRHALIICTEDGELRILDDRSMNGVFVNGRQVEWSALRDGDEITLGRFGMQVLSGAPARAADVR